MATVVGLSEGQIAQLLTDLEQIEGGLKAMYDELAELPVPKRPSAGSRISTTATALRSTSCCGSGS